MVRLPRRPEILAGRPVWVRRAVIAHVRPLPDPVPAERDVRLERVPLLALTWHQLPGAPRAQLAQPCSVELSIRGRSSAQAGQPGGSAPSRIAFCRRTYSDSRSHGCRIGFWCQTRSGPSHLLRSHHGRGFGTARRPVRFSARRCAAYSCARASHSTRASCSSSYQRVRVRLLPPGDRGAEREVVVRRPEAVRRKEGEAGPQRAVPAAEGKAGVVHVRSVRKLVMVWAPGPGPVPGRQ